MPIDREVVRRALAGRAPLPDDPEQASPLGPAWGDAPRVAPGDAPRPAAVALPLSFDPEPIVYAVLRASTLRDHAGEVGFPGGKREAADVDLRATALRELAEECAVRDVDLLGALTPVPVITRRFLIHPFVVALPADARPIAAESEIAEVLPIPLTGYLSGERRIAAIRGTWLERTFTTPHFELREGVVLYGASAFMLYELLVALAGELSLTLPDPVLVTEPPWGDRYGRP